MKIRVYRVHLWLKPRNLTTFVIYGVGVYFTIIAVLFLPPKPDRSEMPISFKLAEAGAGLPP